MKASKTRLFALAAVAVTAGVALAAYAYLRNGAAHREFEGWIEAYFIFVSPDESGRVETLSVREGDPITVGAPLFTLDSELQRRECVTSWWWNARRLAWNWRHVRESECRSLRSRCVAMETATLAAVSTVGREAAGPGVARKAYG